MWSLDIPRTTCVVSLLLFATAIGHATVRGNPRVTDINKVIYIESAPKCSADRLSQMSGTWQPVDKHHYDLVVGFRNSSSLSKSRRCQQFKEQVFLSYTFSPHGCTLASLRHLLDLRAGKNASEFALDNSLPILWAGDSILGQFYSSFTDLNQLDESLSRYARSFLLVEPYSLKVVSNIDLTRCRQSSEACPRGTNEYVRHHESNATPPYHRSIESLGTWGSLVEKQYFKTIVLNTGHHFWKEAGNPSEGFPLNVDPFMKYGTMVKNVAIFLQESNFSGKVIYVTSPPGFPNCDSEWVPNTLPLPALDIYSWSKPMRNEHHWPEMFKTYAPDISFTVLNISFMSITRGDAHPPKDCLHYCQLGLPDEWTRILQALLTAPL